MSSSKFSSLNSKQTLFADLLSFASSKPKGFVLTDFNMSTVDLVSSAAIISLFVLINHSATLTERLFAIALSSTLKLLVSMTTDPSIIDLS